MRRLDVAGGRNATDAMLNLNVTTMLMLRTSLPSNARFAEKRNLRLLFRDHATLADHARPIKTARRRQWCQSRTLKLLSSPLTARDAARP